MNPDQPQIEGVRIYGSPTDATDQRNRQRPRSEFQRLFERCESLWQGHSIVMDFGVTIGEGGQVENPVPGLKAEFGNSLVAADLESRLLMLDGNCFELWAPHLAHHPGTILTVFRRQPSLKQLRRLYWDRSFRLTSETWPTQMRAVLHEWDDTFWQLFSCVSSDIEGIVRTHGNDDGLSIHPVQIEREFPNPSNAKLKRAFGPLSSQRHD